MTFDETLEKYRAKREELRTAQGNLDKLANERRRLSKEIAAGHRTYKSAHREYLDLAAKLGPALSLEINAHPMPADLSDKLQDEEKE